MHLDIISPEKKVFEGSIRSVRLPGIDGSFQLLHNHAPLVGALGRGDIIIETESAQTQTFQIHKGMVEVRDNTISVLLY